MMPNHGTGVRSNLCTYYVYQSHSFPQVTKKKAARYHTDKLRYRGVT